MGRVREYILLFPFQHLGWDDNTYFLHILPWKEVCIYIYTKSVNTNTLIYPITSYCVVFFLSRSVGAMHRYFYLSFFEFIILKLYSCLLFYRIYKSYSLKKDILDLRSRYSCLRICKTVLNGISMRDFYIKFAQT